MFGTQRNLYSTDLGWGFALGDNTNFSVFRYQHVGIPNAKFRVGGLSQCKDPTRVFLRCSRIWALEFLTEYLSK